MEAVLNAVESGVIRRFGSLDAPSMHAVPASLAKTLDRPNVLIAGRARKVIAPASSSSSAAAAASTAAPDASMSSADSTTGAEHGATAPAAICFGVAPDDASSSDCVRVCVFSCRSYGIFGERFAAAAAAWNADPERMSKLRFECYPMKLSAATCHLAFGCQAVCNFVNDEADGEVVRQLKANGTGIILNRCAGFDKIDLAACAEVGLKVARVPAYSPEAVAQMGAALLLSLAWRLGAPGGGGRAPSVQMGPGTVVGVLGTGRIGYLFAMIMQGFGCKVVAYDPYKNKLIEEAGIPYLEVDEILAQADVVSLHVPLLPATTHIINAEAIAKMKKGVTLINVSRGALVDTNAVIEGLASAQIGAYGADVYEFEADYFFEDRSAEPLADAQLARLVADPNVQLTGHQAFLTEEALSQIVSTTMTNLSQYLDGGELKNEVKQP